MLLLCSIAGVRSEARERVAAADGRITWIGRTAAAADGSVAFDWSGVTARIRFTGTTLSLDCSDTKLNYFNVWIDREPSEKEDLVIKTEGAQTLVLAQKLRKGEHTVVLQKRSEGEQGRVTFAALETDGVFLQAAGLKLVKLYELRDKAKSIIGNPDPLPFGDKVVGVVMNRDGSVMDVIKNIVE